MSDTFTYADVDDPRNERIASVYSGARNNWTRIWNPRDKTLYPGAIISQNLHSTPIDFGRFMAMWMDNGWVGDEPVMSFDAVQRMLTPVSRVENMPNGFAGTTVHYGQMAVLRMQKEASEGAAPVIIGHGGSDGTWAAAWPELDLMILYFTQSRGQGTGTRLEFTIDELLINPRTTQLVVEIPDRYKPYVGVYVANFAHFVNEPFTVTIKNGHLAVDIPSQLVFELADPDESGVWQFTYTDEIAVSFERGAGGNVDLMKIHQARNFFEIPREGTALAAKMAAAGNVSKNEAAIYVGRYYHPERKTNIEILFTNGRLYVKVHDGRFGLLDPDENGRRPLRANPTTQVSFQTDADGRVISLTRTRDGTDLVMPRVDDPDDTN
jgi:hypothetical protein